MTFPSKSPDEKSLLIEGLTEKTALLLRLFLCLSISRGWKLERKQTRDI